MKTIKTRKAFAIIGALLTGGMGIGLISLVPHSAEAALSTLGKECVFSWVFRPRFPTRSLILAFFCMFVAPVSKGAEFLLLLG